MDISKLRKLAGMPSATVSKKILTEAAESKRVIVLNGSLHPPGKSHTRKIAEKFLKLIPNSTGEIVDLVDYDIKPGNGADAADDDWKTILPKILECDVLVWATPLWWGNHSSLIQRAIERMDSLTDKKGFPVTIKNKFAAILISGADDGAQSTQAGLMEVSTYFGFTLPPVCGFYSLENGKWDDESEKQLKITADNLAQALSR